MVEEFVVVAVKLREKGVQLSGKVVDGAIGASGSGQQYGSIKASQSSGRSPSEIPLRKSSGVIGQRLVRAATRLAVVIFAVNVVTVGAEKVV